VERARSGAESAAKKKNKYGYITTERCIGLQLRIKFKGAGLVIAACLAAPHYGDQSRTAGNWIEGNASGRGSSAGKHTGGPGLYESGGRGWVKSDAGRRAGAQTGRMNDLEVRHAGEITSVDAAQWREKNRDFTEETPKFTMA